VKEKVCYLRSLDYFTESILSLDVTKLNIKAYSFRAKPLPGPFYQRVLLSLVILWTRMSLGIMKSGQI